MLEIRLWRGGERCSGQKQRGLSTESAHLRSAEGRLDHITVLVCVP